MLREDYNFSPFSLNSDDFNHASGHVSNCINWLDEHLHTYLENNKIKPKRFIGEKVEQFKELHNDNKDLADLMKKIVHLRNAFQHGKTDSDENQLYILFNEERIKPENELMQKFQKNYNTVYNWLISQLQR